MQRRRPELGRGGTPTADCGSLVSVLVFVFMLQTAALQTLIQRCQTCGSGPGSNPAHWMCLQRVRAAEEDAEMLDSGFCSRKLGELHRRADTDY